ncbi:LysR family transcriptional regulator [Kitasatospora sp. MMS16-BH015]|uniref:LysR family transcriptional regulator n=1 Tax=Kitasatospora sp. MMS16-BH015 TaxID=2018025 RepID=UPI000CA34651|nr:LysR family transcriptional regulator [Kitasatospora sp. MMS16-BH015]AUG80667.1 LysR family transcriptional regulator [Kitasatospora sp. MMS16-BH015]
MAAGLERHELEVFLTLAEELHFGRTADRLLVSRAHVSQTLQKLERRIGAPLFLRTSRTVGLTPLGSRLAEDLAPLHRAMADAVERAVATARGINGTLRVGFVGALWGQLFGAAADAFQAARPGCVIELREVPFGVGQEPLRTGEIQLSNVSFPFDAPDMSVSEALVTEGRVLAVSAKHPFARRPAVFLEDMAEVTMLTIPTLSVRWSRARAPLTTPSGRPIPQGPPVASMQELLALVAAGKGAFPVGAQMNRFYLRPDVAYVPIEDAPPLTWGLVWRTGTETPLLRDFAATVAELAPAHA